MHHSFSMKERIRAANGNADNHVVWRGGNPRPVFDVMDDWLTALEADHSDGPLAAKLTANRPADVRDGCFAGTEPVSQDEVTCDTIWPYYGNPRMAAGAPLTNDVMKCALKPLDRTDPTYGSPSFTDAQWARLEAAFPTGVCDWSRPDVASKPSVAWMSYVDGPGRGKPLPPPASQETGPTPTVPEAPLVVLLLPFAVAVGGMLLLHRRRKAN
jgi:hypothetical protein